MLHGWKEQYQKVVLTMKMCVCVQAVADHIPQLVQGVRGSQAKPEDLSAQLALIIASQNFLQVHFFYNFNIAGMCLGWRTFKKNMFSNCH